MTGGWASYPTPIKRRSESMFFSSLVSFHDVALWGCEKYIYLSLYLFNYTFFLALFQTLLILQSGILQRTILQRTNATTNSFVNKIRKLQRTILQRIVLSIKSRCYNERSYNERMPQRTVLSIKSGCYNERSYNERMPQRTDLSIKSGSYNER